METQQDKTIETGSRRLIRAAFRRAVPCRYREQVLGDFDQHCVSTGRYIARALDTFPYLIARAIRLNFDAKFVAAQAGVMYIAFIGASLAVPIIPMLLVIAVALGVLMVRSIYSDPARRAADEAVTDCIVAATFALFSQIVLAIVAPSLRLPPGILIRGLAIGLLLLSTLRFLFRTAHSQTAAVERFRWTWKPNLVWFVACIAEFATQPDKATLSDVLFIFMPMAAAGLVSTIHKAGSAPTNEHRHVTGELMLVVLLLVPTSMVFWNFLSNLDFTTDDNWLRTWTHVTVLLLMLGFGGNTVRYSLGRR